MKNPFNPKINFTYELPQNDSWPETKHQFDQESIWAVRAALVSGRPLLIRGEPGIGKSQLARAIANVLKVPFLYHVIDERSERDDLLYRYDAVSRMAQAQMVSILAKDEDVKWEDEMAENRFIKPDVLWWAFNWESAQKQAKNYFREVNPPRKPDAWVQVSKEKPSSGCVVLIDEIDKADPAVPNGLLESLGNEGFQTSQMEAAIRLPKDCPSPLLIITTNEEREMPAAFLRRCLVYHMKFPPVGKSISEFLLERGRVFWPEPMISDVVCFNIIETLEVDRQSALTQGASKPGAAEYLDILNILGRLHPGDETAQSAALNKIKDFALKKHLQEGVR